jgi:ribosome biogenesis GTPase A
VQYYWDELAARFELTERPEDTENADEIVSVMEAIGRKRGCIVSGGRVDLEKSSKIILRELRAGKLGRFSLEAPY